MRRMATRKSHSCWWSSHISPRNSKWLSENLQETDRLFNEMLKLIEEDGDSFAKKAQMYYQRRPELVSHVEDFYRLYLNLAERYDNLTTELAKNVHTELHSQGSINGSEFGTEAASLSITFSSSSSSSSSERTSEHRLNHFKHCSKAAGFEVFLGFGESLDHSRKGSDESSSETGSVCDNGKVFDDSENPSKLEARIIELENELQDAREKLDKHRIGSVEQTEHFDFSSTTSSLENQPVVANMIFTDLVKQIHVLQEGLPERGKEIENLKLAIGAAIKRLETEILSRDNAIKGFRTWICAVLNKFVSDCPSSFTDPKSVSAEDKDEIEQIYEQKSSLEIENLDEEAMAAQSSDMLLQEKTELEAKISCLVISSRTYESKLHLFEEKIKQLEAENDRLCTEKGKHISELNRSILEFKMKVDTLTSERDELKTQVIDLMDDIECWDDESRKIDKQLNELHIEHAKLIQEIEEARESSLELTNRVKELEDVVESQREVFIDCAEGKKEAIRQLCFSLEHYRIAYQELRQIVQVKPKGLNS